MQGPLETRVWAHVVVTDNRKRYYRRSLLHRMTGSTWTGPRSTHVHACDTQNHNRIQATLLSEALQSSTEHEPSEVQCTSHVHVAARNTYVSGHVRS